MKKILIVEDEPIYYKLLIEKLGEDDFELLQADDGKIGLEMALKNHPDLIVLDIYMPIKNGIEFLKDLREDEWGKSAKVIVLTNIDFEEAKAEAMKLGALKYIIKTGISLEDIASLIKKEAGKD